MSKHRGEARRCTSCGRTEDDHRVRHIFTNPDYGTDRTPILAPGGLVPKGSGPVLV